MNYLIAGTIVILTGTFLMTRDVTIVKFIGMIVFIIGAFLGIKGRNELDKRNLKK